MHTTSLWLCGTCTSLAFTALLPYPIWTKVILKVSFEFQSLDFSVTISKASEFYSAVIQAPYKLPAPPWDGLCTCKHLILYWQMTQVNGKNYKTALPNSNKTLHNAYKLAPLKRVTLPETPPKRVLSESRGGHQTVVILVFWPLASQSLSLLWDHGSGKGLVLKARPAKGHMLQKTFCTYQEPLKISTLDLSLVSMSLRPWRQSIHSNYKLHP